MREQSKLYRTYKEIRSNTQRVGGKIVPVRYEAESHIHPRSHIEANKREKMDRFRGYDGTDTVSRGGPKHTYLALS